MMASSVASSRALSSRDIVVFLWVSGLDIASSREDSTLALYTL